MGYESHWTGEVRIEPPLSWAEIRSVRSPGLQDVKLELHEQTEDTPTGQIRTVTAVAVRPLVSGAFNGYSIQEELQALVDAHPSHEFTGAIEARPLDPGGTPWRYIVQARKAVRQEPLTVWPGEEDDRLEQARRIAVALEQENAHLTEQVKRVRAWATSHEYRWLHELLDGYGTHGGHL